MRILLDKIDNVVPPDTKTTGIGGIEVYASLGRDAGIYLMDYSDMTIDVKFVKNFDSVLEGLIMRNYLYQTNRWKYSRK